MAVTNYSETEQPQVGIVQVGDRRFVASCRIAWDGIEYVGRLWFIEEAGGDGPVSDRSAFPGRTPAEVVALAKRLTPDELERRLQRAQTEKRRYLGLRRATDEMLAKIRYINQVAISMRAGLLDPDGAAGEIELTEKQMHELIAKVRDQAGVEN
jgi:hypothetical protein